MVERLDGAFPGKVDTALGFTRDRHSMSPKSNKADLGGFPIGNATSIKSRALARAGAMLLAAGLALTAFSAAAAEKVSLRLDWVNSGYHAIWYYGIDKGIFANAGIDLEVLEGKGSAVTAQTVGNGSVMFGTADTAAVMGLVSQGLPIKVV